MKPRYFLLDAPHLRFVYPVKIELFAGKVGRLLGPLPRAGDEDGIAEHFHSGLSDAEFVWNPQDAPFELPHDRLSEWFWRHARFVKRLGGLLSADVKRKIETCPHDVVVVNGPDLPDLLRIAHLVSVLHPEITQPTIANGYFDSERALRDDPLARILVGMFPKIVLFEKTTPVSDLVNESAHSGGIPVDKCEGAPSTRERLAAVAEIDAIARKYDAAFRREEDA